jgi:hypothetical protein
VVIGDIVGGAVSAAFSGDEARLARMNNLDKEIERRVQPRADQLEVRAESLCRRMETLDSLDDAMTYRLPDGRRLDLIDAKVEIRDVTKRWSRTPLPPLVSGLPPAPFPHRPRPHAGVFFSRPRHCGWRTVARRPQ